MKIIGYIFFLVGVGLLTGTFFAYQSSSSFLDLAVKTEGTVVDMARSRSKHSTLYSPVIRFSSQQGQEIEFTSPVASNPPSYTTGEKVEVLYDPAKPQSAQIKDFFSLWGLAAILGGLGGIFFAIGAVILLMIILKGRKDEYLKKSGTAVETEFQRVEINKSISVNGKSPFRIISQWQNPATSELYVFESNNLWFDPTNYINDRKITVFIDKNNPKKYCVDTSFLPNLAN